MENQIDPNELNAPLTQDPKTSPIVSKRSDFVGLVECPYGNPNGDPDAEGAPRIDPETQHGIISKPSVGRKLRDYITMNHLGEPGYNIYVQHNGILNWKDEAILNLGGYKASEIKGLKAKDPNADEILRDLMCLNYYDARAFGSTATTLAKGALGSSQIHGVIQINWSPSIDPITIMETTITRCAINKESDAKDKATEMGRAYIIPYGLYKITGTINAVYAPENHFTEYDLQNFWEALANMYEVTKSATRAGMSMRRLVVFEHNTPLGAPKDPGNNITARSPELWERVVATKREGVVYPRSYSDYEVTVNTEGLPSGVKVIEMI